jgi:hypothetical protein
MDEEGVGTNTKEITGEVAGEPLPRKGIEKSRATDRDGRRTKDKGRGERRETGLVVGEVRDNKKSGKKEKEEENLEEAGKDRRKGRRERVN